MKHLINEFYLDTDKYNYIILERSILQSGKNKGKETFNPVGFYGKNLKLLKKGLLEHIIHMNIINIELENFMNMIDDVILKLEEI